MIKSGIIPDIIVFDKKEARERVDSEIEELLENFEAIRLSAKNPPRSITHDLWNVVKKSLDSKERVKIFVDGEEDLVVTPFILESNNDTVILYGLMNKGFVLVNVNKNIKEKCKELLSKFRKGR